MLTLRWMLVAIVAVAVSCGGARDDRTPSDLVPSDSSPNGANFEPGIELVAGSTVPTDRPAILVHTILRALPAGSKVVVTLPTAVGEETDSLWSIPTLDREKPGAVWLVDAGESAEIVEAGRSLGGAGRVVVRLAQEFNLGHKIRIAFTGQVPRTVNRARLRVYEIDGRTGAISAAHAPVPPIVPEPAAALRLTLPSDLVAGESAALHIAALDRFGNVDTRYRGSVSLLEPALPEPIAFTEADAGLRRVEGIRFDGEGIRRIRARVEIAGTQREVESNPVRVYRTAPPVRRFFGDAHFHSGSDVVKLTSPGGDHRGHFVVSDDAYRYLREVAALDWGTSAEHDSGMTPDTWLANQRRVGGFDEPGRFVTLFGYEWTPNRRVGHHVVIFEDGPSEGNPLVTAVSDKPKEGGVETVEEVVRALHASGRRALLVPHMMQPFPNSDPDKADRDQPHETWDGPVGTPAGAYVFDDVRRVAEIYSHHNDDLTEGDYRQATEGAVDQPQVFELGTKNPWSLQHAWATGHKVGVIGGSDNHLGTPGMDDYAPTVQHHSGLAVVLAPELTRKAVFDALYARRCYATTGPKIWLDFAVDGEPMGSDLRREPGARLTIAAEVAGTAPVAEAEVLALRDGEFVVVGSAKPDGAATTATIRAELTFEGPTVIYFRVRQMDGEMAWSSPVWVE